MQLSEAISFIQSKYLQDLVEHDLKKKSVWADLGCGSGLFTKALSYYLNPGSTIYAVDKTRLPEPEIHDKVTRIISWQADFEKMKLPVDKLDGILMANSLHYVKDKKSFLLACGDYYHNEVFIIVEYDTHIPVARWVPYPVTYSSLKGLFAPVGFNQVYKTAERPSSFGGKMMYVAFITK